MQIYGEIVSWEKYPVNGGNSVERFGENSKIFGVNEKVRCK